MIVYFHCPACQQHVCRELTGDADALQCQECRWSRLLQAGEIEAGRPARCLLCGCSDLWRQKDFPQRLGLALVGAGILLSTIAWYYVEPLWAIGILMGFALLDLALYTLMSDVLVCYRCGARYRHAHPATDHPHFDLDIAERYRQEARRLADWNDSGG